VDSFFTTRKHQCQSDSNYFEVLAALWIHGGPLKSEEARLDEVEKLDPQGQLKGQVLAVRAVLTTAQGDPRQSVKLAQQALAAYLRKVRFGDWLPCPVWDSSVY